MNNYEGMFIIRADLDNNSKKKVIDSISGGIIKEEGTVTDLAEWGRRKLAYRIGRKNEGLYILAHFSLEHNKLDNVQKALGLNENIIKTLIVKM